MKIGIMTYWCWDNNYGSQLQCWALQQVLKRMGHQPYLIRYIPTNDIISSPLWMKLVKAFNPFRLVKHIRCKIKDVAVEGDASIAAKKQGFADFRAKHIDVSEKIYTSYEQLRSTPPPAECYIAGSDQVWNQYNRPAWKLANINRAFFLDFGSPETKRFSYAASWGGDTLRATTAEFLRPLLKSFTAVSVREDSGRTLCTQCGRSDAQVVPDPTLLLEAADYRRLAIRPVASVPDKYILLYSLDNPSSVSDEDILAWATKRGSKVIYITGNFKRTAYPQLQANTCEWLWLIDHAERVITNSYHCCLFSFVLGRPFSFNRLTKSHVFQNGRLRALRSWMDIDAHVFSCLSGLDSAPRLEQQAEPFKSFQAQGIDFLRHNLYDGDSLI